MRRSPARGAPGEDAAAEECSLKRGVAVNAAAAEACNFARRIQSRHRLAIGADYTAVEISLQTAKGFARQNPQANRNQRTGTRVEQFVRARSSDQPVAEIAPGGANSRDLGVFAERIVELKVAGGNLMFDLSLG